MASVEDAIADARVFLTDTVRTPLEQKGTGVRGAMLMLLLSFIADSSKTVIIFGIEEPEAFLHPEAYRQLGAGLEGFTQRHDVTLLVTTHCRTSFSGRWPQRPAMPSSSWRKGPNVAPRWRKASLKLPARTCSGRGCCRSSCGGLTRCPMQRGLAPWLEGWMDLRYLELAAGRLGIDLQPVHVVAAGGALAAAVQAVTLRGLHHPEQLVAALFDDDDEGRAG